MNSNSTGTGSRAVDRAAALLVAVVSAGEPVSFPDLVEISGLPKSTVSRLLSSLERNTLIRRLPDGDVAPGDTLVAYARAHKIEDDLISLARPALERLGDATGETINLAVPAVDGVAQIDQRDPRFMLGAVNWLDRQVPYHCSALGKVFLAYGTALPTGRLARFTDDTITSRSALAADLRRTRERGYAVADGELEPGLIAVAAPILDENDHAIAALSVSGPASRITARHVGRIGDMLLSEVRTLSLSLPRSPVTVTSPGKVGAA